MPVLGPKPNGLKISRFRNGIEGNREKTMRVNMSKLFPFIPPIFPLAEYGSPGLYASTLGVTGSPRLRLVVD